MHFHIKKLVWGGIAALCVVALALLWFVGLPVPDFVMKDDKQPAKVYTIQIAPYKFFDIGMSVNDVLVRTDYSSYYRFEEGSIEKTSTQLKADLINGQKRVYGRPRGFMYRMFDECTIQINSETSMSQAYDTLINGDAYTVEGYFDELTPSKQKMPATAEAGDKFLYEFTDGIWGNQLFTYDYDADNGSLMYFGDDGTFYSVQTVFGVQYDVINQLLATAKACYGCNITEYWANENFVLFTYGDWVLGVRYINRNTQRVVVTNSSSHKYAALQTIIVG